MEVPLTPVGRREIHQLENVLLVSTLFRPDVIEKIRNAEDRLTWVDSLAVAAGALARAKAGKSAGEIAEELGRSEQTVRNHLNGKTEAGKLVIETYNKLARGELGEIPTPAEAVELKEKIKQVKKKLQEALEILS